MAKKSFVKDGMIYDAQGSPYMKYRDESENKNFAVIAKCGHCGNHYFIPIMFNVYCKDVQTAIELVKSYPRVKRDRKDVILDAFEISELESLFINAANDHDPYLRGYSIKSDDDVMDRRILNPSSSNEVLKENKKCDEEQLKSIIKTADRVNDKFVLEKYFSPYFQGGRLIYPQKVNRRQLLDEFFKQSTMRYGIKRGHVFFTTLYYQLYGENNELEIKYDNGNFILRGDDGKLYTHRIPEVFHEKLIQTGVLNNGKTTSLKKEDEKVNVDEKAKFSAIDRFNKRMQKHKDKVNEREERQPGE